MIAVVDCVHLGLNGISCIDMFFHLGVCVCYVNISLPVIQRVLLTQFCLQGQVSKNKYAMNGKSISCQKCHIL